MVRLDSFARVSRRRAACACALAAACALCLAWPRRRTRSVRVARPSYRIFLTDGTPLLSAGEFVRSDGRVVFSMPIGGAADPGALQVVSLPDSVVDWDRTNRYADAVRHRRYAASQGEDDYLALSNQVARALSDMAFAPDAETKLRIGEEIRRQLMAWPADHFGYRAEDVRDMVAIVEESLTDVRADAGEQAFDLQPGGEHRAARRAADAGADARGVGEAGLARPRARPTRRTSGCRCSRRSSWCWRKRRAAAPEPWMRSAEQRAKASLAFEARVDREYARTLASARARRPAPRRRAATSGPSSRCCHDVRRQDDRLGRQRPDTVAALIDELTGRAGGGPQQPAGPRPLALSRRDTSAGTSGPSTEPCPASRSTRPDFDAVRTLAGPGDQAPRRAPTGTWPNSKSRCCPWRRRRT